MLETVQSVIREQAASWLGLLGLGAIYTLVVFKDEGRKRGPHLLSKENSRPLTVVLTAHLAFLVIFLAFSGIVLSDQFSLPGWLIANRHRDSVAVIVLVLTAEVLSHTERGWLYRGMFTSEQGISEAENSRLGDHDF